MSKVEITTMADGSTMVTLILPHIEKRVVDAITEIADKAVDKLVAKFWEEHQDKIAAKFDLTGLANLIAIKASEALKK